MKASTFFTTSLSVLSLVLIQAVPAHAEDLVDTVAAPVTESIAPVASTPVVNTPASTPASDPQSVTAAVANAIAPLFAPAVISSPVTPVAKISVAPTHAKQATKESKSTTTKKASDTSSAITSISTPAKTVTASAASTTVTLGAAAIVNTTLGSPANVQGGATVAVHNLYSQNMYLPLNETLAFLCLSLALFVIGIVFIRRDAIPFMARYSVTPNFARTRAVIR